MPLSRNKKVFWGALPLLFMPWWSFKFPDQAFWDQMSDFDSSAVGTVGGTKWGIFTVVITLITVMPLAFFFISSITSRFILMKGEKTQVFSKFAVVSAKLIVGGYIAIMFWSALISSSMQAFHSHISHLLVMLAAALLGTAPYGQSAFEFSKAVDYIWRSGAELGRPNLSDLLLVANIKFEVGKWVNVTSIALFLALSILLISTVLKFKKNGPYRIAIFGYGFLFLMLVSESLSSTRGAFDLDFRYYAYGGWFGMMTVCVLSEYFIQSYIPGTRRFCRAIGILFGMALVGFTVFNGVAAASQNALYGRQIFMGFRTAPNLYKLAGIHMDIHDWASIAEWRGLTPELQNEYEKAENSHYHKKYEMINKDSKISITCRNKDTSERLQLKLPLSIPIHADEGTLFVRTLLQSSNINHMPAFGISVRNVISHKVIQYRWGVISSDWAPGNAPVEYACGVPFDAKSDEATVLLDWAPAEVGESAMILNLEVGSLKRNKNNN